MFGENAIQNEVKHTLVNSVKGLDSSEVTEKEINDILQTSKEGWTFSTHGKIVKETHHDDYHHNERVKGVIRNGEVNYLNDIT